MNKITTYYSVMHSETLSAGIYVTLTLTPTQMLKCCCKPSTPQHQRPPIQHRAPNDKMEKAKQNCSIKNEKVPKLFAQFLTPWRIDMKSVKQARLMEIPPQKSRTHCQIISTKYHWIPPHVPSLYLSCVSYFGSCNRFSIILESCLIGLNQVVPNILETYVVHIDTGNFNLLTI